MRQKRRDSLWLSSVLCIVKSNLLPIGVRTENVSIKTLLNDNYLQPFLKCS